MIPWITGIPGIPGMPGVGPSPARPGPETGDRFLEKCFLFIIGVAMAPFLESTVATRISRQCGSGPGGQEIQDSTRKLKKNGPRDMETTGRRPKIREKGGFPMELGIDRLHLEPIIDFLGPGSPTTS